MLFLVLLRLLACVLTREPASSFGDIEEHRFDGNWVTITCVLQ
jgi:hypothetical protein